MRLRPQFLGDSEGIDTDGLPPFSFVSTIVNLAMVTAAEWNCQFVAHLAPKRPILGKAKVMRVRRLPATYEAWLL
jgi:hypothetical protein